MSSRTLALIKPDAVASGHIGDIIYAIEFAKFSIEEMWMTRFSRTQAVMFYAEHEGKNFFDALVVFMSIGPLVVLVLEHEADDAVARWRALMGPADANKAEFGTLRSLYGDRRTMYRNAVHGSDSEGAFLREWAMVQKFMFG